MRSLFSLPRIVLYTDHQILKFLNNQRNIYSMLVRWTNFLQKFMFVIKYKSRATNYVLDVLSCRTVLLTMLREEIVGLDCSEELYEGDEDFGTTWPKCSTRQPAEDFPIS